MSLATSLMTTHAPRNIESHHQSFNASQVLAGRSRMLQGFGRTTLAELERAELLDRVDTKYVLGEQELQALLPSLSSEYRVLEVQGRREHRYRTLYFDTADLNLYHQHRVGREARQKVRSRAYLDSGLTFLEVKSRGCKGRTMKYRLRTAELLSELGSTARDFVAEHSLIAPETLQMVLANEFVRVTLLHRTEAERLTLDFNLRFDAQGRRISLPGVVIAELKQGGLDSESPFLRHMRDWGLESTSVSKYCVGTARLNPEVEQEAFAPMLNILAGLSTQGSAS